LFSIWEPKGIEKAFRIFKDSRESRLPHLLSNLDVKVISFEHPEKSFNLNTAENYDSQVHLS